MDELPEQWKDGQSVKMWPRSLKFLVGQLESLQSPSWSSSLCWKLNSEKLYMLENNAFYVLHLLILPKLSPKFFTDLFSAQLLSLQNCKNLSRTASASNGHWA